MSSRVRGRAHLDERQRHAGQRRLRVVQRIDGVLTRLAQKGKAPGQVQRRLGQIGGLVGDVTGRMHGVAGASSTR
jgi:hypothetical protein